MRSFLVVVALLVLGGLAGLGAIALGLPDVAATTPHWSITRWVLSTTMEHGVRRRATGTSVPADLDEPARIRAGAAEYHEMCVACHGAPGSGASEIAKGLLPEPPKLAQAAKEWSAAELFWITKHGVRMTGMPAFGPTHPDRKIWDVVAFVHRLPAMSPAEYRSLTEDPGGGAHDGDAHGAAPEHELVH